MRILAIENKKSYRQNAYPGTVKSGMYFFIRRARITNARNSVNALTDKDIEKR